MFIPHRDESPGLKASNKARRLRAVALPPGIRKEMLLLFDRWVSCNGRVWAVKRVKALRDCILKSFSEGGKLTGKPEWVATTSCGNLKGFYGRLYHWAISSERHLREVIRLLGIFTTEYLSEKEVPMDEILDSTVRNVPAVIRGGKEDRRVYPALAQLSLLHGMRSRAPVPLFQVLPAMGQIPRLPFELEVASKSKFWTDHEDLLVRAVGYNPHSALGHNYGPGQVSGESPSNLASVDLYTDFYVHPDAGQSGFVTIRFCSGAWDEERVAGSLNISAEPGCKERHYFSPNLVFQRALDPLKDSLARIARNLPWDCTFNQRKADCAIRASLAEGRRVFSFDLHAATDNFPWWFQKRVLLGLLDKRQWIKKVKNFAPACADLLIDLVENGNTIWEDPSGFSLFPGWTKGQPLGLGPSFFLFTISHGLLLYILNGFRWEGKWYNVGDDVVLLDEELARKYLKVLEKWEVGVSELKCFSSDALASFAGMTYTKTSQFWSPKWYAPNKDNVLDLCRVWPELANGFKEKDLILRVLALPEPWGIGYNPKGLSLDERAPQEFWEVYGDRALERERIARPSATCLKSERLTIALSNTNIDQEYLWDILCGYEDDSRVSPYFDGEVVLDTFVTDLARRGSSDTAADMQPGSTRTQGHNSSMELASSKDGVNNPKKVAVAAALLPLRDGTDTPGFPPARVLRSRDPRTLGSATSWRRTFKEVDRLKAENSQQCSITNNQ